jgi:cation diffusion facilitator family transporter
VEGSDSRFVVIAAIVANAVIMVAKFGAAILTGSAAMFAEGVHSAADTANQALLLFGDKRSRRAPDAQHPFGYGQEIYFWALIVAIVLFGIGGGLSIYEGALRLMRGGGELESPTPAYVVLGIAFVAEGTSFFIGMRQLLRGTAVRPVIEALRRSKDPKLFIPIGEDTAALAGILVAFLGVFLSHVLDMPALDAAASIVIGLLLCGVAFFLAGETRGLLVGERADPDLDRRIRAILAADPDVRAVLRLLTLQLGPDEILLTVDLRFRPGLSVEGSAEAVERIERRIREVDGRVTRIFVEPRRTGGPDEAPEPA